MSKALCKFSCGWLTEERTEIVMRNSGIRNEGLQALEERLGIVETVRVLQQFGNGGSGDYTKEKYEKGNAPMGEGKTKLISEWLVEGEDATWGV